MSGFVKDRAPTYMKEGDRWVDEGLRATRWESAALAFHTAGSFYKMDAAWTNKEISVWANSPSLQEFDHRVLYVLPEQLRVSDAKAEHADRLATFAAGRCLAECPRCAGEISYRADNRGMVCGACDEPFTISTAPLQ